MLAERFVFSKSRGGFDENKLEKKCRKNEGFKNKTRIERAGSLRIPNFKTINDQFEKSRKTKNCEKGDPLGFLNTQIIAKYQKLEGGPFGAILKISEKSLIVPKKIEVKTIKIA